MDVHAGTISAAVAESGGEVRQLTQLGVACDVIAPSLVPTKAGDRVKTDRRDSEKLARCLRAGDLKPFGFRVKHTKPCGELVRVREAAKKDQLTARRMKQ